MLPASTSHSVATTKTLLVVEDDHDVRDAMQTGLSRHGYHVETAQHGLEALTWLRSQPLRPSAIVLDWMMPVMDGMAFLAHVASDPRLTAVPVVVVSAVTRSARIPSLCVSAVVAKPVRLRTLVDLLDRICHVPPRGGGGGGNQALFDERPDTSEHLIGNVVAAAGAAPTSDHVRLRRAHVPPTARRAA